MSRKRRLRLKLMLVLTGLPLLGACSGAPTGLNPASGTANIAPTAVVAVDLTQGNAPLLVQFDARGSADPDGRIVSYAYDFDGVDPFDQVSAEPSAAHAFTQPGLYEVRLCVVDDRGAQAQHKLPVNVNLAGNAFPLAALTPAAATGTAPLDVAFDAGASLDPDGSIVKYEWDFDGDGNFDGYGSDSTISHTYHEPGAYFVRLRVSDADGAQSAALASVVVSVVHNTAPVAEFTRTPAVGDAPLLISFDAGGSSDSDGSIVRYDWDFDGDGGWDAYDSSPQVSHLFTQPGLYSARLRVTDDQGEQTFVRDGIDVQVPGNLEPLAQLNLGFETLTPGSSILLNAAGSSDPDGDVVKYEWDFEGDGVWDGYGELPTVNHVYLLAGEFSPLVRVSDDQGSQTVAGTTLTIAVVETDNAAPTAFFTATPTSGFAPLAVIFDASASADSDGSVVKYEWDFNGDGAWDSYSEGPTAGYIYFGTGTFTVSLRVTDDGGATAVAAQQVQVNSGG